MPDVIVERIDSVGDSTVAIELRTPPEFDALPGQFVLIRASIDGDEETGYYTISSPDVEESFETTVAVDPDGTLGPWLADRTAGETVTVEGPFGNVQYSGDGDAIVFAGGPGIGPAVGIGERARREGRAVTVVYGGTRPPHRERLNALEEDGATVAVTEDLDEAVESISFSDARTYVFGFEGFIEEVGKVLSENGIDTADVEIENFGSE